MVGSAHIGSPGSVTALLSPRRCHLAPNRRCSRCSSLVVDHVVVAQLVGRDVIRADASGVVLMVFDAFVAAGAVASP